MAACVDLPGTLLGTDDGAAQLKEDLSGVAGTAQAELLQSNIRSACNPQVFASYHAFEALEST